MISNPLTEIPNCVIWLDAADTSTLGTSSVGPSPIVDGDFVRYWQNKADPSKSFIQNSATVPTYYSTLSAVNLQNQYTTPFLRYSATPGNEFVFNKQMTTIMLCSLTRQVNTAGSSSDISAFELSASLVQYPTSVYVPLMVSRNELGRTGQPDSFYVTVGSGINRRENFIPNVINTINSYNFRNTGNINLDISQNISEAYMLTSRLSDNFLVNFEGLNRTEALSSDTVLLNHWQLGGSTTGILSSVHTTLGGFEGAIYEVLVYDRALTFEELNDIQNYFYRKWTPIGVKIKRDIYPENSGNWSTVPWSIDSEPPPWNTIVPTDEVFTNEGYTIDIDTDIHVDSIVNKKIKDIEDIFAIGRENNGTFNITNGVSITSDFVNFSSNHYYVTMSPSATASITGSFYGAHSMSVQIFSKDEISGGKFLGQQDFFSPSVNYEPQLRNYLIARNLVEGASNSSIDRVTNQTVQRNKVFTLSADGDCSLTINGDITSASKVPKYMFAAGQGYRPIFWNSSAPLFLNGDIIRRGITWSPDGSFANLNRVYHVVTSGPMYMKGNIRSSRVPNQIADTFNYGISSNRILHLSGNVFGNSGREGFGIINAGGLLYINGDLEINHGSPANSARAVISTGNGKNYINGNIYGSKNGGGFTQTDVYALDLYNSSYAYVLGNIYGGVGNTVSGGVLLRDTSTTEVSGDVYSLVGPAIYSINSLPVSAYLINDGINYSGGEYSVPPIIARKMFIKESNNSNKQFTKFQRIDDINNSKNNTFYWSDLLSFTYPPSTDVQHNLKYGPSYSLSGTMHIPETSAVAWDIPIKTNTRITKLIPGERYEIISTDPFVPFTNFGASADIPGVTFFATGSSSRGGLGIAKTVGKSVVTTVDIMREKVSNMNPGSHYNPTLRTYLENGITESNTISAIAKSLNYLT